MSKTGVAKNKNNKKKKNNKDKAKHNCCDLSLQEKTKTTATIAAKNNSASATATLQADTNKKLPNPSNKTSSSPSPFQRRKNPSRTVKNFIKTVTTTTSKSSKISKNKTTTTKISKINARKAILTSSSINTKSDNIKKSSSSSSSPNPPDKTSKSSKSSSSSSSSTFPTRKRKTSEIVSKNSKISKRVDTPRPNLMGNSTSLPNADSRESQRGVISSESPSFQEIPSSDYENAVNRPRTRSKLRGIRNNYYETNPPLSARQQASLGIRQTKKGVSTPSPNAANNSSFNALNTPSPNPTFSLESPPHQNNTNNTTTTPNSSKLSQLCGLNSPKTKNRKNKNKNKNKSDNNTNNSQNNIPSSPSILKTQHSYLVKNSTQAPPPCIYSDEHFWLPNEEVPARLEELDRAPVMEHDEALSKAWNDNDSSQNIIVIDNGYTLHRHPVAQSTDAIRGKMSYSSGMHAIEFVWEHGQRGTHAVLGVCTKAMRLERPGYCSLIGNDANGWGWDITRNRLFHNGHMVRAGSNLPITTERENGNNGRSQTRSQTRSQNTDNLVTQTVAAATQAAQAIHQGKHKNDSDVSKSEKILKPEKKSSKFFYKSKQTSTDNYSNLITDFENGDDATAFYPHGSEDFVIPARIIMIIDCDEGWVGFCSEGKWLGIAFSTLKRAQTRNGVRRLPGALYPCISCVWGNCEVSMKPLSSISAKALSLNDICRKSLWRAAGGPARGFYSTEQMCRIINYEEHKSGPIPDKLKRYLLAPTKHSLPSKILSDEFCRGEFYQPHYYSPIKNVGSIESNTESSVESSMERFMETPTPELPRLPENSENSNNTSSNNVVKAQKKYNLRSRNNTDNSAQNNKSKKNKINERLQKPSAKKNRTKK